MFWLYSGNVSPINNHYYLSESRSSFEWMLIFYSCICADAYQCFLYVFLNLYPDNYTNLSLSPSFLSLDWTWKREKEVLTSVLLSACIECILETKVSVLRKWFICWSVSKPCSQWSLEFITSVAMVQEYWSGVLEAASQKEETCPVSLCYNNSKSVWKGKVEEH